MNGAHRGADGLPAWLIPGPCVSGEGLVGGGAGSCLTEEKGGCKVGSWESRPLKQVLGSSLPKPLPLGYKL